MRGYTLTTDMDFRVIPSAVPLQSPSPDRKSLNMIAPTLSPNTVDIKKNSTPIKNRRSEKENKKDVFEHETEYKYQSHTPTSQFSSALQQKDQMIKNLKNIINCITDSSRNRKENDTEYEELRSQVKILTIQNQKLVNIIEKMSKNKNIDEGTLKMSQQQYESKLNELMKTMKQDQSCHEQETRELKRLTKSLNAQCKMIENQKNELQNENKKLLKILKQKNENEKRNSNLLKLSDASDNSNDQKSQVSSKSQDRLTLMKIRQQHSENMKMLKEGLIKQIEQTFDTMKIALDGINVKVLALSKRLESLETMTWARVRKTHVETESIKISIREGANVDPEPETNQSFNLEKKSNSEIYIEQGPASSHERASRDQFSRLQEVSSQKNLNNPLQEQLAAVKSELHQLRFKYEKMCLDSQSLGFSQRLQSQSTDLVQISQKYKQISEELGIKNRQIQILYGQIKNMEEQRALENEKKDELIRQKQSQVEKIKQIHEQDLAEMQMETQQKVKLLLESYEKEVQLLKRQVSTKKTQIVEMNASLNTITNQNHNQKSEWENAIISLNETIAIMEHQKQEWQKTMSDLNERAQKYQNQKQQLSQIIRGLNQNVAHLNQQNDEHERKQMDLKSKTQQLEVQKLNLENRIKLLQIEFASSEQNWVKLQQSKDHELQVSYQTAQHNRKRKQQIQQQTIIQLSEISQSKIEIETLQTELINKEEQLQQQRSINTQSQKQIEIQQENSNNLRDLLASRQSMIVKLRQTLMQWNNSSKSLYEKQSIQLNGILNQQNLQN